MNIVKICKQLLASTLLLVGFSLVAAPLAAYADTPVGAACTAIGATSECTTTNPNGGIDINNTVTNVINVLSIIIGIVAVIMIMIAGLNFITSGGDSNKVSTARSAVLYAIIGLIIVGLAQGIVWFVIDKATTSPPASNSAAPANAV